jgi:hypothetical protein
MTRFVEKDRFGPTDFLEVRIAQLCAGRSQVHQDCTARCGRLAMLYETIGLLRQEGRLELRPEAAERPAQ